MKEKVIVYPAVLDNSENSDDVYTVTFLMSLEQSVKAKGLHKLC